MSEGPARKQYSIRKIVVAAIWISVGLAANIGQMSAHSVVVGPPIGTWRAYAVARLFWAMLTGTAFGLAIGTFLGRRWLWVVIGIVGWIAILEKLNSG
jgi:hypothetical protein